MPGAISDMAWVLTPGRYSVDEAGCWIWAGHLCPDGYGKCNSRAGQSLAHRAFYTILTGSIPEGFEVDHLCKCRSCVNPKHLEAVPPLVNRQRTEHSTPAHRNTSKTHCKRGHPLSGDNVLLEPTASGGTARKCITCKNLRARLNRARRTV